MLSCNIRVRGQVQGVGFRPFVHRVASELRLSGWVRNDSEGVEIAAQGEEGAVSAFLDRLRSDPPALARVDAVEWEYAPPLPIPGGFSILESRAGHARTGVPPDAAICPDCLAELFDPGDRRYRYPFINCTHCGPRYTITRGLPYDRPNTSMDSFAMCPACRAEYAGPRNRRFHAQPNACPRCGPRLSLAGESPAAAPIFQRGEQAGALPQSGGGEDVIAAALGHLRAGRILAIKGLGGFHLACDARQPEAVARLRERKGREEKPFAIMAANSVSLVPLADVGGDEEALLVSRERPIVLLRKKPGCDLRLAGVAPGMAWLGAMLPYTPLHYLLFHEAAGRPAGTDWLDAPQELLLVMTSANPGGEPLVTGNGEARERLAGIADALLLHDREIVARCDDSVARVKGEGGRVSWQFLRRARGYTPRGVKLPARGPSVLAWGGWFKNTVCLTRDDEAFLSPHIGDLDNAATCKAMEEAAAHLMEVLEIEPEIVAHDLHPDFHSSRHAVAFAAGRGIPAVAVQHHHAHVAAVLAEHGVTGPALGLALDGVGLGTDGKPWGGELLLVEGGNFTRLGHLKPLRLPGGDRAAREPWRMAAAALFALGRGEEITRRFAAPAAGAVRQMLERNLNSPETSSCGRLFDAAAGLLGVKGVVAFEGQAAMLLEGLAQAHGPAQPLRDGYVPEADGVLDFLPLLAAMADAGDAGMGAALFHATLAEGLTEWVIRAAERFGVRTVALGGGCLLNAILSRSLRERLARANLTVLEARQAPPNDGGLSLGQAWVAMNGK
jgi:hydrogenase maturation protein HypF